MRWMRLAVMLAAICATVVPPAFSGLAVSMEPDDAEPAAQVEDGFEQLLAQHDGRYTKHGWNHYGPGHFDLDPETGILTSHGGMGLLWYAVREYADLVLELEFKCEDEHTNSGVFVRVPGVPTSDDYIYHSFEVQIDEAAERGIHQTGAIYDAEAPTARTAHPPGEWNHFRIAFVGDRITVELNGQEIIDWLAEPRGKVADFTSSGYVGLQNHDDRSAVSFRNIRIRAIGEMPDDSATGETPLSSSRARM